jgi:hypothetical protein
MKGALYILAIALLIFWILGAFIFVVGAFIHILLIVAAIFWMQAVIITRPKSQQNTLSK